MTDEILCRILKWWTIIGLSILGGMAILDWILIGFAWVPL